MSCLSGLPASRSHFCQARGLRLTLGLADQEGALVLLAVGCRFTSAEELWRRTGLSAGGFRSLGERRREALWAICGVNAAPLPLFAAADEWEQRPQAEVLVPAVALELMSAGREVVEDYRRKA